jgi:outer membrane cobalamin receptor
MLAVALGLCFGVPAAAAADSPASKPSPARKAKVKMAKPKKEKPEKVVITGSRLPQEIVPGKALVTAAPVDVITSEQIRRMGATSVPFVLSRQPGFR